MPTCNTSFNMLQAISDIFSSVLNCCLSSPLTSAALVTVAAGFVTHRCYKNWSQRRKWNNVGKDVVVLHCFKHIGRPNPNLGPFVVKLEAYLKMAGIKYEVDFDEPMGPKNKSPWITFNGQDYSDSQLIMEHLSAYFKVDFSKDLTDEERAVARCLQITAEEHIYWGLVSWRYCEDPKKRFMDITDLFNLYFRMAMPVILHQLRSALHGQGLGRHTIEERRAIIMKDLDALSVYLGKKPFFMGDQPREVDCCIFGQLSQMVWNTPGSPYEEALQGKYRNLQEFCVRMKKRFG